MTRGTRARSISLTACTVMAATMLAACNAGPLLKTGSLATPAAAPAPKVATAIDRALHVGATSARAQRCGFYFDPAALRTNFLAAESQRGTQEPALTKAGQSYDFTAKKIAATIKDSETYCNKTRNAAIRTSLQGVLAGNFEPPPPTKEDDVGIFGNVLDSDNVPDKFNPNTIYDPLLNKPGTPPSDE